MGKIKQKYQKQLDILKRTKNPILNTGFTANSAFQILKEQNTLTGNKRKMHDMTNASAMAYILRISDEVEIISDKLNYENHVKVYRFKERII